MTMSMHIFPMTIEFKIFLYEKTEMTPRTTSNNENYLLFSHFKQKMQKF